MDTPPSMRFNPCFVPSSCPQILLNRLISDLVIAPLCFHCRELAGEELPFRSVWGLNHLTSRGMFGNPIGQATGIFVALASWTALSTQSSGLGDELLK
jgi:hypothetical protein